MACCCGKKCWSVWGTLLSCRDNSNAPSYTAAQHVQNICAKNNPYPAWIARTWTFSPYCQYVIGVATATVCGTNPCTNPDGTEPALPTDAAAKAYDPACCTCLCPTGLASTYTITFDIDVYPPGSPFSTLCVGLTGTVTRVSNCPYPRYTFHVAGCTAGGYTCPDIVGSIVFDYGTGNTSCGWHIEVDNCGPGGGHSSGGVDDIPAHDPTGLYNNASYLSDGTNQYAVIHMVVS